MWSYIYDVNDCDVYKFNCRFDLDVNIRDVQCPPRPGAA